MSLPKMPKIIYGTAWKKEQTKALVIQAVLQASSAFRAIDTACQPKHYRSAFFPAAGVTVAKAFHSEDLVGEALVEVQEKHGISRDDLFVQTKYTPIGGQDKSQPLPYDPSAPIPTQIRSSFNRSLKNLRTTWLDSYLLHSPLDTPTRTKEAWAALCELRNEGLVRRIGVSNTYDAQTLQLLQADGRVDVVQNRWYEGNAWDLEVYKYCREQGIAYESFWTLTGSPSLYQHPLVNNIAKALKATNAQVVYRLAQFLGIIPLAGSTNEQHMRDGLETEKIDLGEHLSDLRALVGQ